MKRLDFCRRVEICSSKTGCDYGCLTSLSILSSRSCTSEHLLPLSTLSTIAILLLYVFHTALTAPALTSHSQSDRSNVNSPEQKSRDTELIGQARIYALLQNVQHTRESVGWAHRSTSQILDHFHKWDSEIDDWYSIAFPHLSRRLQDPSSPPSRSSAPPSPSSELSLNLIGLFARMFVNLAGSKEPCLASHPSRWKFVQASAQAALALLRVALVTDLTLLLPFYIKARPLFCFTMRY